MSRFKSKVKPSKPEIIPLEPTKTFRIRQAVWVHLEGLAEGIVGIMEVQESRREGTRIVISRYLLQELYPDDGRRLRLLKPNDGEVYFVHLARHRHEDACDCTGFGRQGKCKHTEALRKIADRGGLFTAPQCVSNGFSFGFDRPTEITPRIPVATA